MTEDVERPSLGDLPPEIIDLIVEFVLGFPGRPSKNGYTARTSRELFSNPIIRTSKQLRRVALNILTTRCIWVRFSGPSPMLRDLRLGRWDDLTIHYRRLISSKISLTYDIICDRSSERQRSLSNVELDARNFTAMFPFSPKDCFEFLSTLARLRQEDTSGLHLSIFRNIDSSSLRQTLDSYILQPLQYYCPRFAGLMVDGEELGWPPPSSKQLMWDLTNAVDLADRLKRCLDHVKSLQESAWPHDAAFPIRHSSELIKRGEDSLVVVNSLISRMPTHSHVLIPLRDNLLVPMNEMKIKAASTL